LARALAANPERIGGLDRATGVERLKTELTKMKPDATASEDLVQFLRGDPRLTGETLREIVYFEPAERAAPPS
jgi:hypothetical protein